MGWKTTACLSCTCAPCQCKPGTTATASANPSGHVDSRPWRHLYDKARWRKPVTGLRDTCLRKHPICQHCNRNASTVADHIVAHKGNEVLFFLFSNLQGLCKECHDKKTAGTERTGQDTRPALVGDKVYNYSS
jgi:5-methylcytosine-specific restriction protein A